MLTIEIPSPDDLPGIRNYDRHIPQDRLLQCLDEGQILVLRDKTRILGILRWSLFWQTIPFCDLLYLDETVRGMGWGGRMMAHWENTMGQLGYPCLMTSTQADETAKFFYEKLGYRRIGAFLPHGQEAEELIYEKLNK